MNTVVRLKNYLGKRFFTSFHYVANDRFFFLSFRLASGEREICLLEEISPRLVSDEIEMTALKWLSVIPMRSEESHKINRTVLIDECRLTLRSNRGKSIDS